MAPGNGINSRSQEYGQDDTFNRPRGGLNDTPEQERVLFRDPPDGTSRQTQNDAILGCVFSVKSNN